MSRNAVRLRAALTYGCVCPGAEPLPAEQAQEGRARADAHREVGGVEIVPRLHKNANRARRSFGRPPARLGPRSAPRWLASHLHLSPLVDLVLLGDARGRAGLFGAYASLA